MTEARAKRDPQLPVEERKYESGGEICQEAGAPVGQACRRPSARSIRWAGVTICALIVAGLEASVLLQRSVETDGLPPPGQTLALYESDPCARRQDAIMRAVADYKQDHGEPPASLSALGPPYLAFPAVEPFSGRPYDYVRQGKGASLSCPNPDLHPLPSSR